MRTLSPFIGQLLFSLHIGGKLDLEKVLVAYPVFFWRGGVSIHDVLTCFSQP